ncbi:MAG: hypothetical protein HYY03_01260, partial [Chloroflexi bacterium]|nr:hypothetical protein [Chloroflexota bacterium]
MTFTRDRMVIPLFDSAGRIVARIEAITTPAIGTGTSAVADVIRYQVVSEKTATITDFSSQDARVGRVAVSVTIGLTDMAPANASLGVATDRTPSSQDVQRSIENAISGGNSLLKEIGYLAIVTKSNLDKPGLLTDSAISMDVGKGFVDANGAENIRIVGINGGVGSVLPTTLAAYNETTATFEATAPPDVTT